MMQHIFLVISTTLILTLTGCAGMISEVKEPIYSSNGDMVELTQLVHSGITQFDMSTKEGQLEMIKAAKFTLPVPFDTQSDENRALLFCDKWKQDLQRINPELYKNVEMVLLGRHPTNPTGILCLPNIITEKRAEEICIEMGKEFFGIAKNNKKFYCINKIEIRSHYGNQI